jgi:hypothetical protein
LKKSITKISLFILIGLIIFGCNTTKRVPDGKSLLTKNNIVVDGKKNNIEDVFNQLYQKQNTSILGYRLRLNIYNLAKQKNGLYLQSQVCQKSKKIQPKSKMAFQKTSQKTGRIFLVFWRS